MSQTAAITFAISTIGFTPSHHPPPRNTSKLALLFSNKHFKLQNYNLIKFPHFICLMKQQMRENLYVKYHVMSKTSSSLITRRSAREMSQDSMSHLCKTRKYVSNGCHHICNFNYKIQPISSPTAKEYFQTCVII